MIFQHPEYLLIWGLIPVVWLMARRSFLQHVTRTRRWLVIGLQALLLFTLALALADPRWLTQSDTVNLLFCVDASESVSDETWPLAEHFMQASARQMRADDQAGLVAFGKTPALEVPLSPDFAPRGLHSDLNAAFSNIADALQFALGKFPAEGQQKIVLFTDGNQNLGDAAETATLAASLGVQIYPVSLPSWFDQREVYVQSLDTPAAAPLETPYDIRVVIVSAAEKPGNLILLRNDSLLLNDEIALQPGKNVFQLTDRLPEPGLYQYKAVLNVPDDGFFQNNEGLSFTRGTRRSQILYLSDHPDADNAFTRTLDVQGLEVVRRGVSDLSGSLHELLEYNAIILDNLPADQLSFATMDNIKTYVQDMGGGLLMLGGDRSFGAGLYNNTPIEDALPVFMDVPTDLTVSGLCLVFVIDKSSSMATRYQGKTKLDMAKIAAFSSIELLNPGDQVGIMAFDWEKMWSVPIMPARERQAIADELSRLRESGGTNLFPALEDVFTHLREIEASRKHVIVLSDGRTEDADFQSLVQAMIKADISVSTVAIGSDSDQELMEAIAEWGGGRSYFTDDPGNIPNIFTGETKIVTKELIAERDMRPTAVSAHDILNGIDAAALPMVAGQVLTFPKPSATIVLETEKGPLLAAWRLGLGRSLAFTSDLSGRWGNAWVNWQQYGQFTAQLLKWVQRKESEQQYQVSIDRQGDEGTLTLDVTDRQFQFINHLALKANLLLPSQQTVTLPLEQIAPGQYRAPFPAEEIGEYYFTLFNDDAAAAEQPEVFGYGIPYTDEFTRAGVNTALLEDIARLTGGQVLQPDDIPADLFAVTDDERRDTLPLWPYCAGAFLALLPLNVAVRKFVHPA